MLLARVSSVSRKRLCIRNVGNGKRSSVSTRSWPRKREHKQNVLSGG